ncbi:hypothetical protein CTJ10_12250 [Staphylococcus epidermidis]|nr:hypothetical protein CTJ10_12250 [Staphylococcus epidermidis]
MMKIQKHITSEIKRNLDQNNRVYRHPILIERKTRPIQLEDGTWRYNDWVLFKKVFANISKFNSSEEFEAGQTRADERVRFFIRYMPDIKNEIKEDFRIAFKGRLYNIENINNINERNEEMEISCVERSLTDAIS